MCRARQSFGAGRPPASGAKEAGAAARAGAGNSDDLAQAQGWNPSGWPRKNGHVQPLG